MRPGRGSGATLEGEKQEQPSQVLLFLLLLTFKLSSASPHQDHGEREKDTRDASGTHLFLILEAFTRPE